MEQDVVPVKEALALSGHECAQVGCQEPATLLVMESHNLSLLFRSGAGVVCRKHADQMAHLGGVVIDYIGVKR